MKCSECGYFTYERTNGERVCPNLQCGYVPPAIPTKDGKKDFGKPYLGHLLDFTTLQNACAALQHGAVKYGRGNWRAGRAPASRYLDATLRHLTAYAQGEKVDAESGLPHIGHAIASLMILAEKEALELLEQDMASRVLRSET